jgi:superfamily II DNA or RNA helicase
MGHPILQSLSTDFDPVIQQRGEKYFHENRVRINESEPGNPGRVLAFVQGTRRYTVQLSFNGADVSYSCTCPYFFNEEQPCKHLWAVLLKLDGSGFFHRWDAARSPLEEEQVGDEREFWDRRYDRGARAQRPAGELSGREAGGVAPPGWQSSLKRIREYESVQQRSQAGSWPAEREILYLFDIPQTLSGGRATVHLFYRDPGGDARPLSGGGVRIEDLWEIPDSRDREILGILRGGTYQNVYDEEALGYRLLGQEIQLLCPSYLLDVDLVRLLLPRMAETGRLFVKFHRRSSSTTIAWDDPVVWDDGSPWEFSLALRGSASSGKARLEAMLRRGERRIPLSEPELLLMGGLMLLHGRLVRYTMHVSFAWISVLRKRRQLTVPVSELAGFLQELLSFPDLDPLEIDESLGIRTVGDKPLPKLKVSKSDPTRHSPTGGGLIGELSFLYGDQVLAAPSESAGSYVEEEHTVIMRDAEAERQALQRLLEMGFRNVYEYRSGSRLLRLGVRRLPEVVEQLLQEGWQVEAEGRLLRSTTAVNVRVVSGVDWFEIHGGVRFGDAEIGLPELLKALRKGDNTVRLGDGSYGVLPDEWLRQQGFLLELGESREGHLRFRSSQALLIDLLLQDQPESSADETFRLVRKRLRDYTGIRPLEAPDGFVGTLRGYQREGLGWFQFLDQFGFGGCLADDMGLGKTVQILALLAGRRSGKASLVVVPNSLVFNWKQEAMRFTPGLRILEHTGVKRGKDTKRLRRFDVVLTTYGTMRNDISLLKDVSFDYIILDEAQIIKNPASLTAKAARLLQGRRRLALSGTPIENHLGELWSLFEFLNPGILGGVTFFRKQMKIQGSISADSRELLARYLKPFILRRTKEQVAPELPDKVEQTLFCELESAERRRYDQLKRYYQRSLQQRIESEGLRRSKIKVLEALLRLRQAACHPGLLDKESVHRSSTKLALLLQHLEDVVSEERKALVFSQFTSLLKILRPRLDEMGFVYEYLDGRTRDRARRVQRFQEDPDCRLFLISLKAGGLGLNLTAAEYVFLMDPWWNPASEAQAIDRTHRIGQDKKVFAYRLIAKDTVEEKVLELQRSKRELAEAIISQDIGPIGELSRDDLALLLS